MRVLINGAGIAGNALAFWLSRLGHTVTVLEQFPGLRTSGLQIDLRSHGIEVLKRMGLETAFRKNMAPEQGVEIVDSGGRRRGYFPANAGGEGLQAFTTDWEVMRGNFCQLLHDANKARVSYVFGARVEEYWVDAAEVHVRLSNGRTETYDLVAGADGVGSKTRRLMLGPDVKDPRYSIGDTVVAYFTMPSPMKPGEEYNATGYLATGKRGVMVRRSQPGTIQVYIGGKPDTQVLEHVRRGDVEGEKAAIAQWMQGAGWRTAEILEGLKASDDFYCERVALVKMDNWSNGRVTLVGDAAYCPSVYTGMGTTCAIVGAYILAGEIAREGNNTGLEAALQAYEARFKPFMNEVQEGVLEDDWNSLPNSRFGVGVFNIAAGLASFFKINVAKWMMKEDIKGWELPVYEELSRVVGH